MSEDVNNAEELSIDEQASEVSEEQLNDENQVIEDVVEDANEEVVESTEEELEEAKKKEDDLEEDAPKSVATPKTKAGVIQAAVDMLKSAKKEDAQKLFAKMAAISEDEIEESEDDGPVAKAVASAPSKKNELKAKAKVEALDFSDDLDTIIAEEATLSDGFKA